MKGKYQFLWTTIALLVVVLSVGRIDAKPYAYSMDSIHVVGNLFPAGATDEFEDNMLSPWLRDNGTVEEAGGLFTLRNPGEVWITPLPGHIFVLTESEASTESLNVQDGAGDFVATTTWVTGTPARNQWFNMEQEITVPGNLPDEITLGLYNFGSELAALLGTPTGTFVLFGNATADNLFGNNPQYASVPEVPGGTVNILLSMAFDDTTNQFNASFSLDGGANFQTPFTSMHTNIEAGYFNGWELSAANVDLQRCQTVLGDVNGDRRVGLNEAVYALQVAARMRPQTPSFVGTYTVSEQYDLNISNGVVLGLGSVVFEVTQIDVNNLNLQGTVTNPDEGSFSFQLPLVVLSSNTATLPTHPYPINGGSANLLEFLLLSDGSNMVYTGIGQEADDLNDISVSVANWVRNPKLVTAEDFVGSWNGKGYSDPNLRDTANGFEPEYGSSLISKIDDDTISISIDDESFLLDVINNRASLANAPVTTASATYHAISMITDGSGMSYYMVVTELNDPTDASVTVGLANKQ